MWNVKKFDKAVQGLPKLYATEGVKAKDKTIAMHLFIGGSDWYICEGDASEGVLFGFACINNDWQNAEWGYVSIEELKTLRRKIQIKYPDGSYINGMAQEVDFDLHWKPQPFASIDKVKANLYSED